MAIHAGMGVSVRSRILPADSCYVSADPSAGTLKLMGGGHPQPKKGQSPVTY